MGTGIKTDSSKITGDRAGYFKDPARANQSADYFIGLPGQHLTGRPKDVFAQVMNTAFPTGLLSVKDASAQMQDAMIK